MPPKVAVNGFLPMRSTPACRHLRGPCGVLMVVRYRAAIFVTDELCLQASVLSLSFGVRMMRGYDKHLGLSRC